MTGGSVRRLAGVELGGTKCLCVLGNAEGQILDQERVSTTKPAETFAAIEDVLSRWWDGVGFDSLGIASFGPIDIDPALPTWGTILQTTKQGWCGANLAQRLREKFAVPVHLNTDVVGAALAEGQWGAAQGVGDFAYVTVGTGVGVGLIVNGRPVAGFSHGEMGHIRVGRLAGDAWPGSCSFHGDCVEGLASGPAIAARAGLPAQDLAWDHPAWLAAAAAIGGLVQTLVLTAAPRMILIGGGVVGGNPALLPAIRVQLKGQLGSYGNEAAPPHDLENYVRAPSLGASAGPLGSLAVALSNDSRSLDLDTRN